MNVTKKLENFNCGENFMARRLMKKSVGDDDMGYAYSC